MADNGASQTAGKRKALVIDDSFVIRKLHRANLEKMDFEVIEASGGREAEEIALKEGLSKLNLLIVDLLMPDMHGAELIERLRGKDDGKKPKIIVCSSRCDASEVRHVASLGINAYIVKPVNPLTFNRKMQELFPNP